MWFREDMEDYKHIRNAHLAIGVDLFNIRSTDVWFTKNKILFFMETRLADHERLPGFYYYDIAHASNTEVPYEVVERDLRVNFFATAICDHQLDFSVDKINPNGCRALRVRKSKPKM